jgi:phenylalanyl-tRNA synthetase beta chain
MRFSLNFIKEFLDPEVSAQQLGSLLTMAGMEVEHSEKVGKDWIFDIEVTTNRYDWLSMVGVAREIASCLDKKLKVNYPKVVKKPLLGDRNIIIEDTDDCPFYIGRVVRGITVGDIPSSFKEKIVNCGVNAINNIVDVTNYCMLKWGNPLHAFDEDKIEGDIYIRRARKGEKFVGIDEKERVLDKENLVIADDRKVIALAGVIGAKNTEVDENTKNVFLEAAIFSPLTVRRSRRVAGIDTDSSYRFERRVSADYLEYASVESAQLIEQLGKGVFVGYKEAGKKLAVKKKKIPVSFSQLSTYLGANLPKPKVKKILANLDFKVEKVSDDKITVLSPSFRFDVDREVDIYEEISRVYGYENIDSTIPFFVSQFKGSALYDFKNELRQTLSLLSLREIVTYSISEEQVLESLGQGNFINIVNPLRKQENVLRTTLLAGMLRSMGYNLNRDQYNLRFFEIANIYYKDKNGFCEKPFLSMGISGKADDFFHLKGMVEGLMKFMNVENLEFKEEGVTNFDNALRLVVDKKEVGFLGKLNKKIKDKFDLKEDVVFAGIDIELLYGCKRDKVYKHFSLYPAIWRDISVVLRKGMKFKEVEEIIKKQAGHFLASFRIVNIYKGKDLAKDTFAFTLRIFYQSKERTLTSDEVASLHNKIRETLSEKEGISLR